MSIQRHAENRAWAFNALDQLEGFLNDPDFEGAAQEESAGLDKKRFELRENKYRVVVLGAFNVGKSALINALLGQEYLPTVLEECTTKITHVMKSDSMRALLNLSQPPSEPELQTLSELLTALGASAHISQNDKGQLLIEYAGNSAKQLVKSLGPLVTMSADEDFPQLRNLRAKFDEVFLYLPNELLAEDVALIDSPGAHSISETNKKIAQEIMPDSHLIICLIDSQSAGTEHDRNFIQGVVQHRHRKVFYVINKCDQLNQEEIDLLGRRGPAKDLFRSLEGIVEGPELFFVSSLYALIGQLLRQHKIELADIDQNNKIKIPLGMHEQLLSAEDPRQAAAEYLINQSRFEKFRMRLLEYLFNENKEGAVLESVCRFIDNRAWTYARPVEIKLEMARNMPRFDELKSAREKVYESMDANRKTAIDVLNAYNAMSGGGNVDGREFAGYETLVDRQLNKELVDEKILKPVREWLKSDANLKAAKKARYAPVVSELETRLDAFLAGVHGEIDRELLYVEKNALDRLGSLRNGLDTGLCGRIEAERAQIGSVKPHMGGSYFGFAILGAILCAVAGGAIGYNVPSPDPAVAAGVGVIGGAIVGFIGGFIIRAMTKKRVLRKKVDKAVTLWTDRILFAGVSEKKNKVVSVRDQLRQKLTDCRNKFAEAIQAALDQDMNRLNKEVENISSEEESLRARQAETLTRLEPKQVFLGEIATRAREIVQVNSKKEE